MPASILPSEATAAVFRGVRAPLSLEQFSLPILQGSEVLVKVKCATICGSDLHSYHGTRHSPIPCILGHEMVGEIVDIGPDGVSDFRGNALQIGDRVTWSMVWSCGECFYCRRGIRSKCDRLMKFGHEELLPERAFIGGMAEFCHLPEGTAILKVAENIPDFAASPANCATATVAAVFRHADSVAEQTVLVHGAGMLGQTACAMASLGDAKRIVVLEPDVHRRETALRFGATEAIDSTQPRDVIRERVLELTAGRGADCGVELSGHPEAIELGLDLLRVGGRLVMAGSTFPTRSVELNAEQVVRRMLRIAGVYNYNPEDLDAALDFLSRARGKYAFEELVGASFPLDEVNAAFDYAERHRPPRVAVIP